MANKVGKNRASFDLDWFDISERERSHPELCGSSVLDIHVIIYSYAKSVKVGTQIFSYSVSAWLFFIPTPTSGWIEIPSEVNHSIHKGKCPWLESVESFQIISWENLKDRFIYMYEESHSILPKISNRKRSVFCPDFRRMSAAE